MSVEVRDKLAGLEGWTKGVGDVWQRTHTRIWHHPIPDDLTTCAAMWDDHAGKHGYRWERSHYAYIVFDDQHKYVLEHYDTGTDAASERRDRWALLGEVLKARGV